MKNLDLHRCGALLKHQLVSNSRSLIRLYGTIAVGLFAADCLITQIIAGPMVVETYSRRVEDSMDANFLVLMALVMSLAASIFSNLNHRQERTAFLLLPATNAEKYVVRWVYASVFGLLFTLAAVVVADTMRGLVGLLVGQPAFLSGLPNLFATSSDTVVGPTAGYALLLGVGLLLLTHATYVLGGVVFSRNQFLITSCIIILLNIALIGALSYVVLDSDIVLNLLGYSEATGLIVHPLCYVLIGVSYVVAALFYWLSYRLFCRIQVVNHKWTNL